MARIINGFLGDAIGKLGNVVFRKWNSMITASKYQPLVKNPNTRAQQAQRIRIKSLALALQPFKDNLIPLNFKNNHGLSTSWAEAIKVNYPLIDENGNILFQNLVLSAGSMLPPAIIKVGYSPFINVFYITFNIINMGDIDLNRIRLTAVGRNIFDNLFNTSNICKLPFQKHFTSYINELALPEWPLNFDFDNAWSEGQFFYNIINSPERDVRAYNPANIVNSPSAGAYFSFEYKLKNFDFSITERIIYPEQIHTQIIQDDGKYVLRVYIDDYNSIPGLNPDDIIYIMPSVLEKDANTYDGPYTFKAESKIVDILLMEEDQNKPFNILYFVANGAEVNKTTATRIPFNHPMTLTYCEMLFKNGLIHPDSVKIHKPYTAIWGDLKDFIPPDLIGTIPYTIHSRNYTTGEERQHVISSDNLFFCSKLLRNQIYTITIKDGETISSEIDVIGMDDDYIFTIEKKYPRRVVKFKAGNELASKVK